MRVEPTKGVQTRPRIPASSPVTTSATCPRRLPGGCTVRSGHQRAPDPRSGRGELHTTQVYSPATWRRQVHWARGEIPQVFGERPPNTSFHFLRIMMLNSKLSLLGTKSFACTDFIRPARTPTSRRFAGKRCGVWAGGSFAHFASPPCKRSKKERPGVPGSQPRNVSPEAAGLRPAASSAQVPREPRPQRA